MCSVTLIRALRTMTPRNATKLGALALVFPKENNSLILTTASEMQCLGLVTWTHDFAAFDLFRESVVILDDQGLFNIEG